MKRKGSTLVVDDEKLIRWSLKECLEDAGLEAATAEDGAEALKLLREGSFDLVLLDYKLPDVNGLELLREIRREWPETSVVMVTAHSNIEHAVAAIREGAADYVAKPFRNEDILLRVEKVLETSHLQRELRRLRDDQWRQYGTRRMIGESPAMKKVFAILDRIIHSTDATILIQGESGTGK
ncbi:MAG TPA: response regulator, partial [Planctomycetota bacterium]|nr:response regulator [Planctomycetota bacterium]